MGFKKSFRARREWTVSFRAGQALKQTAWRGWPEKPRRPFLPVLLMPGCREFNLNKEAPL